MRNINPVSLTLTIIAALITGIAGNYLFGSLPIAGQIAAIALLAVLVFVALAFLVNSRLVPRRFANEVFVLDEQFNIALVNKDTYHVILPPGRRLGLFERPDLAVSEVLERQLGVHKGTWSFWPKYDFSSYREMEKVTPIQPPYFVQIERRRHRWGVREHYDFMYVCTVKGEKPNLNPQDQSMNPQWRSYDELMKYQVSKEDMKTFPDVLVTLKTIISEMRQESPGQSD